MAPLGMFVYCLRPSYVQNIGYHGAYQSSDSHAAPDYVGSVDFTLRCRNWWYKVKRHGSKLTHAGVGAARRLRRLVSR
jgi:hypothetical protein